MSKTSLLIVCCLFCVNIAAQNLYFQKSVLWGNLLQEIWQIELVNNDEYALLGHAIAVGNPYGYSFFWKINANGEEIIPPVYYEHDISNYAATDMLPNQLGYAIIVVKDPDNYGDLPGYPVFLQVDTQGQVLYEHEAVDTINYKVVEQMVRTPEDGGYLAVGRVLVNDMGKYKPYVIKFNANGEKQWEKIINDYDPNLDSRLYDVVYTNEGYFAVGSINSNSNTGVGDIILAQIDITNGSFINEWIYNFDDYYGSSGFDWGRNLLALDDGGFIISGGNQTIPQVGYLLRLDSAKNLVWFNDSTNYDCGVAQTIYIPTDSSFVTTGCATVLYPEVSNGVQVEISKVSAAGNLVWKRHYGVDGADDYAWDMINTPDGGFMVVGRSYSFFWQQTPIYFLKTNCMGLLTQPQAAFAAQMDTAALRITLQNLSQFVYPDSIDGGHYIWNFGDGTTSTQINPTHTYAQGGNYTVTLTAVVCSDTSVYTLPVSTYAVGISNILEDVKFGTLYPNPTKDQLFLDYALGNEQQATISLFDLNGRIVKQDKLTGNGTYSLDTRPLSNGLYIYTVQQNGNVILRDKLVVIK
jgi:PKD repeat protein